METITAAPKHKVHVFPLPEEQVKGSRRIEAKETLEFASLDEAMRACEAILAQRHDPFAANVAADAGHCTLEECLSAINLNGRFLETQPDLIERGYMIGMLMDADEWRKIGVMTANDLLDDLDASTRRALEKCRDEFDYLDEDEVADDLAYMASSRPISDDLPAGDHHGHCMHRLDAETCTHGCFFGAGE